MNDFMKNTIVALISIALTFFIQQYYYSKTNEIKKLDVHQSFNPNFLSKPKFPNSNIELKIDGIDKSRLGLFEVSLLNYSNSTYNDIPIHIKITPENTDEFKVVTHYATGEDNILDLVKELKPVSFDGKTYLFSYQVSTLNRTEKEDLGFTLSMLFEGNKQPKIDVVAKGINTQAFAWEHSPDQQNLITKALVLLAVLLLILLILVVFVVGPFISWISRPFDRKSDKTYARKVYETITDENLLPDYDDNKMKLFVQQMLFKQRLRDWNSKSKISKWSLGMRGPLEEDFLIE
ncbi:MAG: hypothetical protein NTZ60_07640 [Campylobacterales bacterium]|nr:hypothetical protein [Campylobacterales bacterium]